MSSLATFSTTFFTPLHDFNQPRTTIPTTSPSTLFIKSSLSSSNSTFFQQISFNFNSLYPKPLLKTRSFSVNARAATDKTIYDFTVKDIDKKDVNLSKYKGKVLLIVNVASRCGLTSSNYSELSHLYDKFNKKGLEVLAFPCNQFGMQEPGSNQEIKQFACTKFKAEFPIFDKVDVNGPFTAPVYQFLKSSAGGFFGDLVKWNFEKFLVDKNGKVVERYPPTTSPFQIESLCGFCNGFGALFGYLVSGFFVHHLGPQGSLGIMAVAPALTIVLGFVIYENRTTGLHNEKKQVAVESVGTTIRSMYQTILYPQAWKPSLFMFLSLALNVTTHEGHFYWYTDPKVGPAFSQEFVGIIYAIGAVASIIGVLIYHKFLKNYTFRNLVFYAQLLYAISGVLDLIFILRWNLIIGIPDYFFVVFEETAIRITGKIRWMPMMVLSTQLCPIGIEGTFFALLMCIDSMGGLISKWGGGLLLRVLHVTRTDFTNLWLAVLLRDILRFATLALVFLVPNANQNEGLVTSKVSEMNKIANVDEETLELVPLNAKTEVLEKF